MRWSGNEQTQEKQHMYRSFQTKENRKSDAVRLRCDAKLCAREGDRFSWLVFSEDNDSALCIFVFLFVAIDLNNSREYSVNSFCLQEC